MLVVTERKSPEVSGKIGLVAFFEKGGAYSSFVGNRYAIGHEKRG